MKYSIHAVLAFSVVLLLNGCADIVPIESVHEIGGTLTTTTSYVKDASVAKEHDVHETLRNRDRQYKTAYEKSGTSIEFAMQDLGNGIKAYLPTKIAFREAPRFEQQLPIAPSEHPMWKFASNMVDKTLIGWGIDRFVSFGKSAIAAPGSHDYYAGPYAPTQSGNLSTTYGASSGIAPYEVRPEIVYPEVVIPE